MCGHDSGRGRQTMPLHLLCTCRVIRTREDTCLEWLRVSWEPLWSAWQFECLDGSGTDNPFAQPVLFGPAGVLSWHKAMGEVLIKHQGRWLLGGAGLSGVKVWKGTVRTGMNTHKWGIRVFCLLAMRHFAGSSALKQPKWILETGFVLPLRHEHTLSISKRPVN